MSKRDLRLYIPRQDSKSMSHLKELLEKTNLVLDKDYYQLCKREFEKYIEEKGKENDK